MRGIVLILCLFPFRISGNDHGDANQGWAFEKCEAILSEGVGQRGVHTCPCLSVASPISLETGDSLGSFLIKKGTIHTTRQRGRNIRTGDRLTSVPCTKKIPCQVSVACRMAGVKKNRDEKLMRTARNPCIPSCFDILLYVS